MAPCIRLSPDRHFWTRSATLGRFPVPPRGCVVVSVKIRLMRVGKKKQPSYRVVVADSRSPRDGRYLEILGQYQPRQEPSGFTVNDEKVLAWLRKGAQPSDRVHRLLVGAGIWERYESDRTGDSKAVKSAAARAKGADAARVIRDAAAAEKAKQEAEDAKVKQAAEAAKAASEAAAAAEATAEAPEEVVAEEAQATDTEAAVDVTPDATPEPRAEASSDAPEADAAPSDDAPSDASDGETT